MLVSVKVQLPLEALGIVMEPVETVTKPELDKVVVTFKVLAPIANVPEVIVNVVAVKVPPAVKVFVGALIVRVV